MRRIARIAFLSVVTTALLSAGCGEDPAPSGHAGAFSGTAASPSKPAPPLRLENALGHDVDIDQYRGKAVLVTFIYSHCPDVCPLIVGNLHTAQAELGAEAKDLQIIAVSVDPEGDTPNDVNAFLKARRMTGRMEYLIGSRPELEAVWSDWGIVSKRSPKRDDPDYVEHSAMVYGISAAGKVTTLYPTSFRPAEIVHDVPILASQ